jgi:hypothetical protein
MAKTWAAMTRSGWRTVYALSKGRTFPGLGATGSLRGRRAAVRKIGPRLAANLHSSRQRFAYRDQLPKRNPRPLKDDDDVKHLTLLDRTPDWVEALCSEIDTLKFASAFDSFTPDAILAFGVEQITGGSAMQAFFVKIDSAQL